MPRSAEHQRDKDIQHDASLSDSEDEGTGGRRNHQDNNGKPRSKGKRGPSIMDGGRHHDTPTDEDVVALVRASEAQTAGSGTVPPPPQGAVAAASEQKEKAITAAAAAAEKQDVVMADMEIKAEEGVTPETTSAPAPSATT